MSKFMQRLKNIGPGALVAAAFIGPGTVTSCSTSGANYGYTLLWAMLLSVVSVIIMQSMAARLGIVSGMGLGEALRTKFTGKTARVLLAVLVISAVFVGNVAYETGNLSGAVLGLQTAFPGLSGGGVKIALALILGAVAFGLLWSGSYKYIEKFLTALVVIMGVIFLVCAFAVKPDWAAAVKGTFAPSAPEGSSWMTIAALMGTTVVPYNIYLHASSAAKKWAGDKDGIQDGIVNSRFDSVLSIGLGGLISMAIIICAAATIHAAGGSISSGADMAKALEPLLGSWATAFFGMGLFAAGISSAITAPLAAAFASSGILGWGEDMKSMKFKGFWLVVLGFGIFATCTLGASPTEIILFAQAANAFLLPITGVLLLVVCNDKSIMDAYANKTWFNVLAALVVLVFLVIAARNMSAFSASLAKLLAG